MPFDFEKRNIFKRFGKRFRRGRRKGRLKSCRQSAGCICPNCRLSISSQPGTPCFETKCPKCGTPMARLFSPD